MGAVMLIALLVAACSSSGDSHSSGSAGSSRSSGTSGAPAATINLGFLCSCSGPLANSLKDETLGGLAPALTFEAGKTHSVLCWFLMRTENGKFTTPYGTDPSCSPDQA
jgi:hypothetical protein